MFPTGWRHDAEENGVIRIVYSRGLLFILLSQPGTICRLLLFHVRVFQGECFAFGFFLFLSFLPRLSILPLNLQSGASG